MSGRGNTSTEALAALVRAARHMVDCDARPVRDPGPCAFYSGDDHYEIFKRRLREAEEHLAELRKKPS
jgi:hypothetical protein